jgi:hypothetical protein
VIQHFLLTNFDVLVSERRDGMRNLVRTEEWYEERFVLFETFCLPSVAAQTTSDFTWLIRHGRNTPPEWLRRLRRAREHVDCELVHEGETSAGAVGARLAPSAKRVVTTRLDNDDAIRRDFLEAVRAAAGPAPEFLNLPYGYRVDFPFGDIRRHCDLSNMFLSLVEDPAAGTLRTVRCAAHAKAHTVAPVRQLRDDPSWLVVVHGRNLYNYLTGEPCPWPDLEREFNVTPWFDTSS